MLCQQKQKRTVLGFNPVFQHCYKAPSETSKSCKFEQISDEDDDDESSSCSSISSNPVPIMKKHHFLLVNSLAQEQTLSRRQRKLVESRINMENVSREQRPNPRRF